MRKKIKQIPTEENSVKCLTSPPQNFQSPKTRKIWKAIKPKGLYVDMTIKCTTASRMGS